VQYRRSSDAAFIVQIIKRELEEIGDEQIGGERIGGELKVG